MIIASFPIQANAQHYEVDPDQNAAFPMPGPWAGCSKGAYGDGTRLLEGLVYFEVSGGLTCEVSTNLQVSVMVPGNWNSSGCNYCLSEAASTSKYLFMPASYCGTVLVEFHYGGVTEQFHRTICV